MTFHVCANLVQKAMTVEFVNQLERFICIHIPSCIDPLSLHSKKRH